MAHQIQGSENILQTLLGEHSIELVLVDRERDTKRLREVCLEQEIQLEEGSADTEPKLSKKQRQRARSRARNRA